MTWNLWWRFGDWERRRDPIARILDAAAPDIAGLQEVWGGSTENQAHILAETLGMHHAWCASSAPEQFQRRAGDRTVVVGNAILSRWPIMRKSVCELPAGAGDAGRTALFALIDAPFGAVPVFTTHFSSAVGGSELRCKQVGALTQFIAEETSDCANSIVTGDLNAEPDSDEIRLFGSDQTAPPVPGMIFLDVWRFADLGARSWTWDRRNPAVFATGEPDARIDYIFLGHRTNSSLVPRVLKAWLTGNEPVNDVWPSDHAGVVAEVEWRAIAR
jgi:endonuclease/exonuclease/phosphatase family metal-dependent hydrolase